MSEFIKFDPYEQAIELTVTSWLITPEWGDRNAPLVFFYEFILVLGGFSS